MHGIIELYLSGQANEDDLETAVTMVQGVLCSHLWPGKAELDNIWECQHGIGHGVAQFYRQDAARQALYNGLHNCAHGSANTSNCQNGLWMDYFDHLAKTPNAVSLQNAKDIVQACFAFPSITSRSAAEDCIYYAPT